MTNDRDDLTAEQAEFRDQAAASSHANFSEWITRGSESLRSRFGWNEEETKAVRELLMRTRTNLLTDLVSTLADLGKMYPQDKLQELTVLSASLHLTDSMRIAAFTNGFRTVLKRDPSADGYTSAVLSDCKTLEEFFQRGQEVARRILRKGRAENTVIVQNWLCVCSAVISWEEVSATEIEFWYDSGLRIYEFPPGVALDAA